jgi:hypothetical protein
MAQVSNWFINARVRLWRPLIFKICGQEDPDNPPLTSVEPPSVRSSFVHQNSKKSTKINKKSNTTQKNPERPKPHQKTMKIDKKTTKKQQTNQNIRTKCYI